MDSGRITGHELNEPFDVLPHAYEVYTVNRGGTVTISQQTHKSTVPTAEYGALDQATMIDSLAPALAGQGWSKPVNVGAAGFEPATPCL